jgi:hypothetical protein
MGAAIDSINAFTTISESYGDWENIMVAVLARRGIGLRLL